MRDGSKTLETELQRISGYELVRNFLFFVLFVCSLFSKVCGGFFGLICDFLKFLEAFELNSSEL